MFFMIPYVFILLSEPAAKNGLSSSGPLNRSSYVPRLGLARIFSRSADSQDQSKQLYREVISMATGVSCYLVHYEAWYASDAPSKSMSSRYDVLMSPLTVRCRCTMPTLSSCSCWSHRTHRVHWRCTASSPQSRRRSRASTTPLSRERSSGCWWPWSSTTTRSSAPVWYHTAKSWA